MIHFVQDNESKSSYGVVRQSAFGGEITINALRSIVGEADRIYVRIDENKAYWVKGDKTGDIDIW